MRPRTLIWSASGAKLEAAMAALHEAHDALEGYEEAIEADHNSVGSVKLV